MPLIRRSPHGTAALELAAQLLRALRGWRRAPSCRRTRAAPRCSSARHARRQPPRPSPRTCSDGVRRARPTATSRPNLPDVRRRPPRVRPSRLRARRAWRARRRTTSSTRAPCPPRAWRRPRRRRGARRTASRDEQKAAVDEADAARHRTRTRPIDAAGSICRRCRRTRAPACGALPRAPRSSRLPAMTRPIDAVHARCRAERVLAPAGRRRAHRARPCARRATRDADRALRDPSHASLVGARPARRQAMIRADRPRPRATRCSPAALHLDARARGASSSRTPRRGEPSPSARPRPARRAADRPRSPSMTGRQSPGEVREHWYARPRHARGVARPPTPRAYTDGVGRAVGASPRVA